MTKKRPNELKFRPNIYLQEVYQIPKDFWKIFKIGRFLAKKQAIQRAFRVRKSQPDFPRKTYVVSGKWLNQSNFLHRHSLGCHQQPLVWIFENFEIWSKYNFFRPSTWSFLAKKRKKWLKFNPFTHISVPYLNFQFALAYYSANDSK